MPFLSHQSVNLSRDCSFCQLAYPECHKVVHFFPIWFVDGATRVNILLE